jgi:hypothetical protein
MKGQSNYIVGVGAMVFAVTFFALNSWAQAYVLNSAMNDMNDNFARYESAVHSYMIINEGRTSVNNKINQDVLGGNLSGFTGFDHLCYINGDPGWNHPGEEYKLAFYPDIKGGTCSPDSSSDLEFPEMRSYGILMLPMYFPKLQFYGTENGGQIYYVQTRVEP